VTFSIVARDSYSFGVAVASKFLAAGAYVAAAEAGVGAVASQAFSNLAYRPAALAHLREGRSASETVALLTASDDDRESRQVGVVGRSGPGATFTGANCLDWAGGRSGEGYAVQGNILAGEEVVLAMERAWLTCPAGTVGTNNSFAWRLLHALEAGDHAGGDRRGRQSAALLVASPGAGYGGSDVAVDLRVDDHPRPLEELRRLLSLHDFYFGQPDPASSLPLEGEVLEEAARLLELLGFGPVGSSAKAVSTALAQWASMENLEMRYAGGPAVDPVVFGFLRERAAAAQV
jgi:uncharacterized Ntn-hydrolase superfamily protein